MITARKVMIKRIITVSVLVFLAYVLLLVIVVETL